MGFLGSTAGLIAGPAGDALGQVSNGLLGNLANPTPLLNPVDQNQVSQNYNQAQSGLAQQQAFLQALQAQNGVGNQSQVYNQLQGVANGTGPNPALAQLNQQTGANNAATAALMAGQRGAGANTGLIARQAGMAGANNQQNAIGQAATLQAQQQANAIGAAGNLASQQVAQQGSALTGYNQSAQNEQGQILNAANNQNVNNINDLQGVRNTKTAAIGGLANGAGAAAAMAEGGAVPASVQMAPHVLSSNPDSQRSYLHKYFNPSMQTATAPMQPAMAHGGKVPALVSPGERYLPPSEVKKVAEGKKAPIKAGEKIPGKAKVKGDSYENDTVSKTLEAGGIVLPRHVTTAKDPAAAAHAFVTAILAKNKGLKR